MSDSPKPRDLEERTFLFAQSIRVFVKALPRSMGNAEDVRQLIRASGSVAANWIEKESRLFLRLIETNPATSAARDDLAREARELMLIFSAIISKNG